ncbi:MAG: LysM domain-containing protein [Chloroflexota bacterium]|nr:MAG: LysM domain-containing protein [Chloroflexota bacterium]
MGGTPLAPGLAESWGERGMAVYGVECCPFLGRQGDRSSYYLCPSAGACCLVGSRPRRIRVPQQEKCCFTRRYVQCSRLVKTSRRTEPVPGHIYLPMWAMVGVIVLTVLAAWGIVDLIDEEGRRAPMGSTLISGSSRSSGTHVGELDLPTAQLTSQATVLSSITALPTTTPSATPTTTSTVLATATPTATAAATSTPIPPSPTASPVRVAPAPSPFDRAESYVVQPGDTLGSIARSYGILVDVLARANGMRQDDVLPVGARLVIPAARTVHVVQAGDTLSSIAQIYGIASDEIAAANQLGNGDMLSVGQQLVIPTS